MTKTIFITGATSGFGKAAALKFAGEGHRVIINGRRKERLEELQDLLTENQKAEVLTLPFDVQQQEAVNKALASLPGAWQQIDVLVNNAGLALGRDYIDDGSLDDWETMINTNIKGLLYVTKAVLPLMIPRKKGHIINIGSTAAKDVYAQGNVYCSTKAAVDSLTKSMRIDLLRHRIKVTSIHPGAAETEFSNVRFKGDENTAKKVYEGYQPLTAEDVADIIYFTTTLPSHVCINDLVVTATQQANSIYLEKDV